MTIKQQKILSILLVIVGTMLALLAWQIERPGSLVWDKGFRYVRPNQNTTHTFTNQLPADVSQIKSVVVSSLQTDIKITQGTKFQVKSSGISNQNSVKLDFKNGQLKIEDRQNVNVSLSLAGVISSPQLLIEIPEEQTLSYLSIINQNGDISLKGLGKLNQVVLKNQNGDIAIADLKVEHMMVSNQNGDVTCHQSQIKSEGKFVNQNGDLTLTDSQLPSFYAKTRFGDLDVSDKYLTSESSQASAKLQFINQMGDIILN